MPAPRDITLTTPIEALGAAGKRAAPAMRLLGVANVGQLIAYLPMRHEFEEAETTIDRLPAESIVTARGEITATRVVTKGRRPRFEAALMDHTGRLDLVWFNAPYMRHRIHPGMRVRVSGKAKRFGPGLQIANPRVEILSDEKEEPAATDSRLRPIYPASEDMPSRKIEALVRSVLEPALAQIEDHLPAAFRAERDLPSLADAYRMMHAPTSREQVPYARRRLAYDELLMLQLGVFMKRAQLRSAMTAPALRWDEEIDRRIRARFPFPLTPAQDEVVREVAADLSRSIPTNRLIQGDVGSGKTVVGLYAMLMAVASKHQAALMAPTELLAEQHFASISAMLEGSDVRVALLTGNVTGQERASLLGRLERGEVDLLIGTHALLTESVRFRSLAVAIIDEQHRFGVHQRARLRQKGTGAPADRAAPDAREEGLLGGAAAAEPPTARPAAAEIAEHSSDLSTPHVLVMTATPIPRTLAITLFGDLDVSTIRGMPPGRKPVRTRVVGMDKWDEVYAYVRKRLDDGDQAYIVVPAIDTGAEEGLNDLRTVQARLESPGGPLAGKRIAALHGRLSPQTREHIMARFRAGLIDALVATTVIEVGVDVPNATVMVVEHADRFGLAQLHQLRGRVGRGSKPSVCVLIGEPTTEEAAARLRVIARTSDGFELAEQDLEIRGPGELFGVRQAGLPPFKVADLMHDRELLGMARRDAAAWIARSPTLEGPGEALLRRRLLKAHGAWLGLADVG